MAEDVIAKEGRSYTVNAFIGPVDFPVKTYGAYSFPAGTYEAVEVVIGEGAGKKLVVCDVSEYVLSGEHV